MKFLVEIPDGDVRRAVVAAASRKHGSDSLVGTKLWTEAKKLVRYSLEENFGKPGAGTIEVAVVHIDLASVIRTAA